MPFLIPIIIPALIAAGGAAIIAGGITLGVIGIFVTTLALGFISQALAPKLKIPNLAGFSIEARDRVHQFRQPITARRIVYGEVRVSGPLIFVTSTSDNKFFHMVIALAGHEVEAIGAVQLNDDIIYEAQINSSGLVTTGKFKNLVRIKKLLGTAGQAADADLVSEVTDWTADHKLSGVAYIYVRLEYDRDVFPSSIPNVSAFVKGAKLRDTRGAASPSEELWSPNPALCVRDYLARSVVDGGLGVPDADIDDVFTEAAANTCDEFVPTQDIAHTVNGILTQGSPSISDDTIGLDGDRLKFQTGDRVHITGTGSPPLGSPEIQPPGGLQFDTDYFVIVLQHRANDVEPIRIKLAASYLDALAGVAIDITSDPGDSYDIVKKAEPRYTANGVVETSRRPSDAITDMLSSMGGRAVHVGESWRILAAGFQTPTVAYDEGDHQGEVRVTTRISRRDRFNAVKGVYVSPLNDGQPTDYPAITNATFQTNDGGDRLFLDLDLAFTSRTHTAQRLAKIELERMRQEITVAGPFNLSGLQVQPGDVVQYTNDRFGFSKKEFEVVEWSLATRGDEEAPLLGVDMVLRETASALFDWNAGEETRVDPAPNTTLPNPFSPKAPTNLILTSGTAALFIKQDGTAVTRIKVEWTASIDAFVIEYEVQFKKSADSVFLPVTPPFNGTSTFIWEVEEGTKYDVRVRGINHRGIGTDFITETDHTVVGDSDAPPNVASLTAQQNGNVVLFNWPQILDTTFTAPIVEFDMPLTQLEGYEIRRNELGNSNWDDGLKIVEAKLSESFTTAAVPPGSWTFMIKSRNKSGIYCLGVATADLVVTNFNDIILEKQSHTDWLGISHALDFNGVDDGVSVPIAAFGSGSVMTFECWVRTTKKDNQSHIFHLSEGSGDGFGGVNETNLSITALNGRVHAFVKTEGVENVSATGSPSLSGITAVDDGLPHHIVFVLDGAQAEARIYVDGVLDDTSPISGSIIFNNYTTAFIGRSASILGSPVARSFKGEIDDVRVWDTVRTATEINDFKDRRLSGGESGLQAYWPFDGGNVDDLTANARNGTLDAAPIFVRSTVPGHFIKNLGKLVPDDRTPAEAAGSPDDFAVFDNFTQNVFPICVYQEREIDLGFDADNVRVHAALIGIIAPTDTTVSGDIIGLEGAVGTGILLEGGGSQDEFLLLEGAA